MEKDLLYQLIERELAGSASPEELQALREWYQSAADREISWEENDGADSAGVKAAIWNNIQAARLEKERQPRHTLRWAAIIAGLLVGTGYLYLHTVPGTDRDNKLIILNGRGQIKRLTLPDGTQVWLNGNSSLSFDSIAYNSIGRDISLSGEAFFDVAKNAGRPFTVSTPHTHIRVLGTAFNIRDRPGETEAVASLIRGKIELRLDQGKPGKNILLAPGEKFAWKIDAAGLADSDSKEVDVKVDKIIPLHVGEHMYLPDTAWKQGEVVFVNLDFKDIAGQLEQKYGVRINILTPSVAVYRYTGIVKDETIRQVLEGLSLVRPFKYTLSADRVEIR